MIERQIIIGCITSTDYLRQVQPIWDIALIEAPEAKKLCLWAWEYYEKYAKAPGADIEAIYFEKLKTGKIPKSEAEDIEDILDSLSTQAAEEPVNLEYLMDETKRQFNARRLLIHSNTIQGLLTRGKVPEAEQLASEYKPAVDISETDVDFNNPSLMEHIERAFDTTTQSLYTYPGALGDFINSQLVQGGFIALMAPEKRGKTFWMLDMAIRACRKGVPTAFFSAGDMNEDDMIMRICVYLAQKSNEQEYAGTMWQPVKDCMLNQLNECQREGRECDYGVFSDKTREYLRREITQAELIEAFKNNPDYKPCYNCRAYNANYWGTTWLKQVDTGDPLTVKEAKKIAGDFFLKHNRKFMLSCHPNDTLTITNIKARCAAWQKATGFIPRQIIIDYADIMTTEQAMEERPKQNHIWKGLRRLSQEDGNPLVVTATQSDADSYTRSKLKMTNFSEDKRKFGHVTLFLSMNQDPEGREKELGVLRLGKLAQRRGRFSIKDEVTLLQNLSRGRPFLTSYK
jgi:hypothetical protein